MKMADKMEKAYTMAVEQYAEFGVNVDIALSRLAEISISIHCWQGDDVAGFENPDGDLTGGIQATGNYPGKARTPDELRSDLLQAINLIPGSHRINLHAIYAETNGQSVARDELAPEHFQNWIDWAVEHKLGMDFNGSFFSHPLASTGFTLSSPDQGIRNFWIGHGQACRRIGAAMGKASGSPCITNVWIPDGYKDTPFDRKAPRERLLSALDEVFIEKLPHEHNLDAVECKLFGIGSESYVVGSHEFYLGYATKHNKLICLDTGHFHPTETVADKISSVLLYVKEIMLHVSRGVRWDSDHVVTLTDDLRAVTEELVRGNFLGRTHIGLDFFDASINRIAAWIIGSRNLLKALLMALLEPAEALKQAEVTNDFTSRLALMEDMKTLPFGAVWNYYCARSDVPVDGKWLNEVREYECNVLANR